MRIFLGHFGIRLDDNRGESLVEVLVSAVIMGLLGLTIVGTIALSQPLSDRVNLTGTAMANLNSASQQIQLQSFQACSPSNPEPYLLSSVAITPASVSSSTLAISTAALPIAQAPSGGVTHFYSTTLLAVNGLSSYAWSVSPNLPSGLSLSSNGVISGTPVAESSANYKLTVTSNGVSVSKDIPLTIVTVLVRVNDASIAWASCQNVPKATITGVFANGTSVTYTYSSLTAFVAGDVVSISGVVPTVYNLTSATVISATSTQFVVADTANGTYVSSGDVGLTKNVNVQQITVSTTVHGNQLFRTIVAVI
jgi:type II secretory pathway pseudopilin PulG